MPAASASARPCGRVDIGFTNATVSGERVTCYFSRPLVRQWLRVVGRRDCDEQNNFCRVTRVRRWRCVQGGSERVVRLRWADGRKRVRAHWGD
jgi:hypothetical protein